MIGRVNAKILTEVQSCEILVGMIFDINGLENLYCLLP